ADGVARRRAAHDGRGPGKLLRARVRRRWHRHRSDRVHSEPRVSVSRESVASFVSSVAETRITVSGGGMTSKTVTSKTVASTARARPGARVAFRFCVTYFALYAAATQILGGVLLLPGFQFPALGTVWPLRDLTLWAAQRVFGLTPPLVYAG